MRHLGASSAIRSTVAPGASSISSFAGTIRFFRGRNTNITNAPVTANVDNVHVMVEIEAVGVGICYDGITAPCTGTGNTQTCKVF